MVVINYVSSNGKLIEEEKTVVDSPEVEISATVKEHETDLQKIIISVNGIICTETPISGKNYKLKQSLNLKDTTNRIKIIAINSMGFQGVEEKVITFQKPLIKASPFQQMVKSAFGKKHSWAVLIGIKDYSLERNGMKPLPYTLNDVQSVKDYLITGLGFDAANIATLIDAQATEKQIRAVLGEDLRGKVGKDDRVLVYFSGHGGKETQRTDEGEKTYSDLIPYDGKKDNLCSTAEVKIDEYKKCHQDTKAQRHKGVR